MARLSAYEYQYSDRPDGGEPIGTRTDKWETLEIPLTRSNWEEIAFLLEDDNWASLDDVEWVIEPTARDKDTALAEKWDDHDGAWRAVSEFATAPEKIRDWVAGLPEYEPTRIHEYPEVKFDLAYGERRDVKCLNCDETYEQRRLSWEELQAIK